MDIAELKRLVDYAEKLGKGLDPVTGMAFDEDTILNCNPIKKYNTHIASLLKNIIHTIEIGDSNYVIGKRKKMTFSLEQDAKDRFEFSEESLSISSLTYKLNNYCEPYMRKVHATDITNWLLEQGYLEERHVSEDTTIKAATAKGNELGITLITKTNSYGNTYFVNVYDVRAQRYIVDNIETIIGGIYE